MKDESNSEERQNKRHKGNGKPKATGKPSTIVSDANHQRTYSPLTDGEDRNGKGGHSSSGEDAQESMLQTKWDEMFNRLIAYKEKKGSCLVPNRYPEDPQLGNWGKWHGD